MAIPLEIADDAVALLARHGYGTLHRPEVFDVDAEGPLTMIAFVTGGMPRTARVRLLDGKERVEVSDGWDVP